MSLSISWCKVCDTGGLEGSQHLLFCEYCGLEFCRYRCALKKKDIDEDAYEVDSCHCPRCCGDYIDPSDTSFHKGYILGIQEGQIDGRIDIVLSNLREITFEEANSLELTSIKEIGALEASEIAKCTGDLTLWGLNEITPEVANALAKHQGALDLSYLTEITEIVAEELANHQDVLCLNSIKKISDGVAIALSKHQGDLWISTESITAAAAQALLSSQGTICGQAPADWMASIEISDEE